MSNALTLLHNSKLHNSNIQPISETTFMVVPPNLGLGPSSPYPICVTAKDNYLILSEDEISEKDLLEKVFKDDEPSSTRGVSIFKAEDLENFIQEDPTLLAELYQLFEQHDAFPPNRILELVQFLNEKGFIPIVVIHKLLAATSCELEKILNGDSPWDEFLKLIK